MLCCISDVEVRLDTTRYGDVDVDIDSHAHD